MDVYKATIINSTGKDSVEIFEPGYLSVDDEGKILAVDSILPEDKFTLHDHAEKLLLPGFIDCHTHLPQYAFAGVGDLELLPWLKKYTFPHEARFHDPDIARKEAANFFNSCLAMGTTTVVAYATMHTEATDIAFQEAENSGIRAFIGKVLMNQNSPDNLSENTEEAMAGCEKLIDKWHGKNLLQFVVSPRFAVSCDSALMRAAGRLSQRKNLFLQTHLSENEDEIATVAKLQPSSKNYTDVYDQHECLHPKTLLGHAIHLQQPEIDLIKKQSASVIHCPTSNRFLGSGLMPFKKYQQANLKLAFGTDVAAGFSLSMVNEAAQAIETSKQLCSLKQIDSYISLPQALFYATMAAAEILGIADKAGQLKKGYSADFCLYNDKVLEPLPDSGLYQKPLERLSRLFYRGSQMNTAATFVGGRILCG